MKRIQRHFHLSKKEVCGLLGLWIVLIVLSALGLYFRRPPDVSIFKVENPIEASSLDVVQQANEIQEDSTFVFNPNMVSWNELTQLGLRDRVASSWIAWRNAGKVFHTTEDIAAVHGITMQELDLVMPYVVWDLQEDESMVSDDKNQEHSPQANNWKDIPINSKVPPRVNLNSANQASLEALPGIGPVLSERIIRYRKLLGGFTSINQLLEVYGLKESHYNRAVDYLYVISEEVTMIDLDTAAFRVILRHPYANYGLTKALFERHTQGISIDSIETTLEDSLRLPYLKLKPYLYDLRNEEISVTISNRAR